ncbi:amino acid permease [Kiritimatiella glycovorans]|uniref:Putative amino acid permease YhdG n=1 Tax=Kiritimatiella glycovorans TaxID=1307763 RepID=A0A0G3EL99_9BACT|nr:amino acid permease [Kiritimatiella glycovorans]AKJ64904.1 putative amino acid permease YhdG [Kiritimatiella glycovorans]
MKLKRELGPGAVFCIATGAMISSGIFVLPGLAHAQAGPGVVFSYVIAGVLTGIGMVSAAELATAMPRAGGDYFFITRALGPLPGSIAGLLNWFALSLKSAFALVGLAAFASIYVDLNPRWTAAALTLVFTAINLTGTRHSSRIQIGLVVGLIALMSYYVARGIPHVRVENVMPLMPYGFRGVIVTAGFVFVAYGGLIKIAVMAEEIRNPSRVIPRAIFSSLLLTVLLYVLMVWVTAGVLADEQLDASLTPIADGARAFLSAPGVAAIGLAACLAFISTANAGILAASRYLFALSRDGLLPAGLSKLTPRTGTPGAALLMTGAFIIGSLFLPLKLLVESASLVILLGFIMSALCVIVLREGRVQNYRPGFRAPFYPWLQITALLCYGFLLFELGREAYLICAVLLLIALVTYHHFGRKQADREYALLHLIERITSKALVTGTLERELKSIIRERDELTADRFDREVGDARVLDIEEEMDYESCFRQTAEQLAPELGIDPQTLFRMLMEREQESSTALTPFLAVPHIVVPGEQRFRMILIRARGGVRFPEREEPIHAVFVLAGTKDERNFHLRALAALAQVVQDRDFEKRWLDARGTEGIRDVVLLARRGRSGN